MRRWARSCCRPTTRREAARIAMLLDRLNKERKEIEQAALEEALAIGGPAARRDAGLVRRSWSARPIGIAASWG